MDLIRRIWCVVSAGFARAITFFTHRERVFWIYQLGPSAPTLGSFESSCREFRKMGLTLVKINTNDHQTCLADSLYRTFLRTRSRIVELYTSRKGGRRCRFGCRFGKERYGQRVSFDSFSMDDHANNLYQKSLIAQVRYHCIRSPAYTTTSWLSGAPPS